ncbi:MAG TPA: HAD-IIIA family hydrolase [Dissulfurispiraceae bacterium]|nr:HAD-IIIA family hydrolase [Dissulfurispiraceae bacterium]
MEKRAHNKISRSGTRSAKIIAAAAKIRLLILDVDGVLTDGSIILDNNGTEIKSFHVRDGHGIKMLRKIGMRVAIITGRYSEVVTRRSIELGIEDVFQRCHVKTEAYEKLLDKYRLSDYETAYIGDDVVDISLLKRVGLPVVVADAHDEAKKYALMITEKPGGRGAVREITDLLIKAYGKWDEIIDEYDKA